jgi:tRNA (cytidine/uridine-2'-O-)-methyltransferase
MLNIALFEPEIPPNTGNVARLCAATFTNLHIVGVTGLDYWEHVNLFRHIDLERLYQALPNSRFFYIETNSAKNYYDVNFQDNDCLIFGRETKGLPQEVLDANAENCLSIPMPNENVRSLNLANSVSIVLFEALRQLNFPTN